MKLEFHKYHGAGNDFILLDNREKQFLPEKETIARLCHRRFGIGADGLILLAHEAGFDFKMSYFNSDGLESTMCGNGGRCIIAFADFLSLTKEKIRFLASDGEHTGSILSRNPDEFWIRLSMKDVTGIHPRGNDFVLDTGSPHLVRFVGDLSADDVVSEGRKERFHEDFSPAGINVNFVQIRNDDIFIRTYERGVEDETLSCGTGVTASALAFAARTGLQQGKISVSTPGGDLSVEFRKRGQTFCDIWLEGPVRKVFRGSIDI